MKNHIALLLIFFTLSVWTLPSHAETLQAKIIQQVDAPMASPAKLQQDSHGIVGLNFEIKNGALPKVMEIYPGTPAARTHLQLGDQVVSVNGISMLGLSSQAVDDAISDIPGETVHFLILRQGHVFPVSLVVQALDAVPSRQVQVLYQGLFGD